jgi:hypothetical protein
MQRGDVHGMTAGQVDQYGTGLHLRQPGGIDQPARVIGLRHVQRHHIGFAQQGFQRWCRRGIAQRQSRLDIVEQHPHADGLGQQPGLRADLAVADDAQGLATHLVRPAGVLEPLAAPGCSVPLRDATQQLDGVADHQLSD